MQDSLSFASGTHVHLNGRAKNTFGELTLCGFVQASLPPQLPVVEGLQFEALYLPCADGIIGGDWYDAFALPDGSVAVTVGDVTGHGAEEAAIMGKIRYSLRVVTLRANALLTGGGGIRFTKRRGRSSQRAPGRERDGVLGDHLAGSNADAVRDGGASAAARRELVERDRLAGSGRYAARLGE